MGGIPGNGHRCSYKQVLRGLECPRRCRHPSSSCRELDSQRLGPAHGPTNADVAKGIGGIWEAVPAIKIEDVTVFCCGEELSCVANIKVVVDENTTLNVCDVIQ